MGADLFIMSIFDKNREKYQAEFDRAVERRNAETDAAKKEKHQKKVAILWDKMYSSKGYYRDSYNSSNLLWALGLDYWIWLEGLLDDDRKMSVENMIYVVSEIKKRDITQDKERSKDVLIYLKNKKKELLQFLQLAIEMDEPIKCSI